MKVGSNSGLFDEVSGDNWRDRHLRASVQAEINGSCFKSDRSFGRYSCFRAWSLRRRHPLIIRRTRAHHFSIFRPVNSRSILKVRLMRLIRHGRTEHAHTHTHTLAYIHSRRGTDLIIGQFLSWNPGAPAWSILSLHCAVARSTVHFGNEPLIGNCVELHPRRASARICCTSNVTASRAHTASFSDDAIALAWNEWRRSGGSW